MDELTSLGGELEEYSQEQSFWALRFLSAVLRASFLKLKTYCRVWKSERPWPYRTNRSCHLDFVLLGRWQLQNGTNKPSVHWMDCDSLFHKICGY